MEVKIGYKNFYIYSAISAKIGLNFSIKFPNVDVECMNAYMEELSRKCGNQKIAMIMDGAGWHKSNDLKIPENLANGTAIAGLAPHANDSGKKKGYRSTGGGRSATKAILFCPAGTAIQHNKELKEFCNRLISKGKTKMKAMAAVMRKMLVQLNAILKKEFKRKEEERALSPT